MRIRSIVLHHALAGAAESLRHPPHHASHGLERLADSRSSRPVLTAVLLLAAPELEWARLWTFTNYSGLPAPTAARSDRDRAGRKVEPIWKERHPERHPQRIHGAQHLHLSAKTVAAHHLRHLRLHVAEHAEVQLDLDLRLPHAGGRRDRRPRTRLHARRRPRIRARRRRGRARHRPVRAAPVVLLGDRHELLHGSRQACAPRACCGRS